MEILSWATAVTSEQEERLTQAGLASLERLLAHPARTKMTKSLTFGEAHYALKGGDRYLEVDREGLWTMPTNTWRTPQDK